MVTHDEMIPTNHGEKKNNKKKYTNCDFDIEKKKETTTEAKNKRLGISVKISLEYRLQIAFDFGVRNTPYRPVCHRTKQNAIEYRRYSRVVDGESRLLNELAVDSNTRIIPYLIMRTNHGFKIIDREYF